MDTMMNIITKASDLGLIHSFLQNRHEIAYDVETTGLNPRQDKVIGFGVSDGDYGYYVAHLIWDGNQLVEAVDWESCREVLKLLLRTNLITFNGSFDLRFTANFFDVNLTSALYADSMLAKHMVDEERPFALKEIAARLWGEDATKEQQEMKASIEQNGGLPSEFYKANVNLLGKYCVQDCILTYKILHHYLPRMQAEGTKKFFLQDEVMPLYREVTIPMESKGIPVDVERIRQARVEISTDIEKLEQHIQSLIAPLLADFNRWILWKDYPPRRTGNFAQAAVSYVGFELPTTPTGKLSLTKKTLATLTPTTDEQAAVLSFLLGGAYLTDDLVGRIQNSMFLSEHGEAYKFNLSSKDHLKRLFFEKLNEKPLSTTDLGNPQVDDLFLHEMAKKYEWCALLQDYNKLNKLRSTYMDRILDLQEEGTFFPSFQQHRTISGRYGSDLQQLPRPKESGELSDLVLKYNNLIRTFFISGPDHSFIDADYESLEPHVFAHVSNDDGLKNIFRNGMDFYSTIAIMTEKLEGVSADKKAPNYLGLVNKPARQKAKAYCLGVPYGMGSFKLSKTLNISDRAAQQLIDDYMAAFPNLKRWMDRSFEDCIYKGQVRSEAGRVRHMPQAPKIWRTHGRYILDSLEVWKRFHENPSKYKSVKYLRKQLMNYINNARNFQIQSLGATIVNRAAIAISREFRRMGIDGYVCANVHDQLVIRVVKNQAEKAQRVVQFLMENSYKISIDLKAPAAIASNLYEGH